MGIAFRAVAGIEIVGGRDTDRRRRLFVRETPAQRFAPWDGTAGLLVQPDLPERLQGGEGTEVRCALDGPHPVQELIAICAHLLGEGLALAYIFRQARLVRSETVAGVPRQGYVLLDPGGVGVAELVERIMHGFQDTCQAVQRADRRQDMGRISPLGASRLDPAACFAGGQEGIQEPLGCVMREQTVAKIVQQGKVKAWVVPVEAEGLLPIHTAPHGIRRLAVGEPCHILPHHDQC